MAKVFPSDLKAHMLKTYNDHDVTFRTTRLHICIAFQSIIKREQACVDMANSPILQAVNNPVFHHTVVAF